MALQFFTDVFTSADGLRTNESSLALNCPLRVTARRILNGGLMKVNAQGPTDRCFIPVPVWFSIRTLTVRAWYNWFPKLWDGQDAWPP